MRATRRLTVLVLSWSFAAASVWVSTPAVAAPSATGEPSLAASAVPGEPKGKKRSPKPPLPDLESLAPHEILIHDQREPYGVAVGPGGRVFFTDEKEGALFEVLEPGVVTLVAEELKKPRGIAWDGAEGLLLVADGVKKGAELGHPKKGVLLRFDLAAGRLELLADKLKHPHAVALSREGAIYVSADGLYKGGEAEEDLEHPDDDDEAEGEDDEKEEGKGAKGKGYKGARARRARATREFCCGGRSEMVSSSSPPASSIPKVSSLSTAAAGWWPPSVTISTTPT